MRYEHINTIYVIMATKRSGHHGIIDWLRFSYEKDIVFYNDSKYPLNPHNTAYNFWINDNYYRTQPRYSKIDFPKRLKCLVWNYEDFDLKKFDKKLSMSMIDDITESYDRVFFITVNRDVFNHQASMVFGSEGKRVLDLGVWKEYAKEHLGMTNYVTDGIHIDYSLWMRDIDEKKKLYKLIGGTKAYKDFYEIISPHGIGSSFNRKERDAEKILKDVLVRWKTIKDTEYLNMLFEDEELIQLAINIYGQEFVDSINNR